MWPFGEDTWVRGLRGDFFGRTHGLKRAQKKEQPMNNYNAIYNKVSLVMLIFISALCSYSAYI